MNRTAPLPHRSNATRRGSAGFTLLEVMLTIGILAVIMVPLMLWATAALMRSNDTVSTDSVSFTQLSQFLKRDVPSATQVLYALPGRDATDYKSCGALTAQADPQASAGDPVLTLLGTDGTSSARFEYVTLADGGVTSMFRRVCHNEGTVVAPSWKLAEWTEVATNLTEIQPSAYADVTCAVRQDDPSQDPCGVVSMTVQAKNSQPVELSQVRRTDGQPPSTNTTVRPIARIVSSPNPAAGSRPLTVRFDGSTSEDPAVPPTPLTYEWSVSPSAGASCSDATATTFTCTFTPVYTDPDNPSTVYNVKLTVTRGTSTNTSDRSRPARKTVEVRNTRPTASIGLSADPVYRKVPVQFFSNSTDVDGPAGNGVRFGETTSREGNT